MLTNMQKIVLSYPKLADRIESREDALKEREKTLKNLASIRAEFSPAAIKSFQKLLDTALNKVYDSINFDDSLVDLKELMKDNCIVLVPNHQSHADYLAINYAFYNNYKTPLYVAGGDNLNIFPIGPLFRKSGCFFIRRSFASDINYKLTLEGYLYYLLKMGRPVEFFFEGGRSRTGKLLAPRYGLYNMLLDAHRQVAAETGKKLIFVPVSIAHEYVPEQKTLAQELGGAKKKKESLSQLLGLVKIFAYQFGSIHIKLGHPVVVDNEELRNEDLKKYTQELAFKCFREVGRNMMVTPTSLLALVLLDEPSGAMLWHDILTKAKAISTHCQKFEIPFSDSLNELEFEGSLGRAMDILIGNKRIDVIGKEHRGSLYYSIREECRTEILYFKNTILHHFLLPSIIGQAWINLFSGGLSSEQELKTFFFKQRAQLKHEFYLPTVNEFVVRGLSIVGKTVGKDIQSYGDLLKFNREELYTIASKIGFFTRALSYIFEAYYVSALSLQQLGQVFPDGFKIDAYNKKFKDTHESEQEVGRLIRYSESYSVPLTKSSLKYFTQEGHVSNNEGLLTIVDKEKLDAYVEHIEKDLNDQLMLNIRVVNS
jgi:glycerol-3-phosphate O-acyltransferase